MHGRITPGGSLVPEPSWRMPGGSAGGGRGVKFSAGLVHIVWQDNTGPGGRRLPAPASPLAAVDVHALGGHGSHRHRVRCRKGCRVLSMAAGKQAGKQASRQAGR